MVSIKNPKRHNSNNCSIKELYPYYAGYSPNFVYQTLMSLNKRPGSIILDPWNGSGTTTRVAAKMGYKSFGYDINPVMVVVALANEIDRNSVGSVIPLGKEIIEIAKNHAMVEGINIDPLAIWMDTKSTLIFRKIEYAIQRLLIDHENYVWLSKSEMLSCIPSLAAFFYIALFKTLKICLKCFQASNPTWIKLPKDLNEKVSLETAYVFSVFFEQVNGMYTKFLLENIDVSKKIYKTVVETASSDRIPIFINKSLYTY